PARGGGGAGAGGVVAACRAGGGTPPAPPPPAAFKDLAGVHPGRGLVRRGGFRGGGKGVAAVLPPDRHPRLCHRLRPCLLEVADAAVTFRCWAPGRTPRPVEEIRAPEPRVLHRHPDDRQRFPFEREAVRLVRPHLAGGPL